MKKIDKEEKAVNIFKWLNLFCFSFVLFVMIPLILWNHKVDTLGGMFLGISLVYSYKSL